MSGAATEPTPTFWAAPDLAKAGYPVFPLKDKAPSVEGGFYACTTDVSQVAEWISEGREHHEVAVATGLPSGVVVMDADTPEAFEEMRAEYGKPDVLTRRGGHWWFAHPRNGKVMSNKVRDGLDRKGDGGYVAVPPSRGRTWTNGIPDRASLRPLPLEFRPKKADKSEAVRTLPTETKDRAAEVITQYVAKIRPGGDQGRHEHLRHLCGVLLARGVPFGDAEDVLRAAWKAAGGELAERAPREVLNTLRTTEQALAEDRATGIPSLEGMTPGLYGELEAIFGWRVNITSGGREPGGEVVRFPSNGRGSPQEPRRQYSRSDVGNAERFGDLHGARVRWCPARKMWLVNDGRRWHWDECAEVVKLAQATARAIHNDAVIEPDPTKQKEIAKFAVASQNEGRINGMLSQAKPHLAVRLEDLDGDKWLINCQNGTLDLRMGKLREHDPADLITKIVPVDYLPGAECPRFAQFLKETLVDDALVAFIKRYSGYTLTGTTRERLFAMLWGSGKNGKSTFVELLQDVMGDYAQNTDVETILAKKYVGVGNDVAALRGARFVSCAEVESGRRLAESKVKQLTGNDTVTARYLFGEPFDFRPEFKLWCSTNNKPEIIGTDDAIWDRIRLIPFTQRFDGPKRDPKLPDKLREELAGVFAWMVEGCLEWQEHGLGEPEAVRNATEQYREEMDTLAAFLADRCVVRPGVAVLADKLYQRYAIWCDANGERQDPQKRFVGRLTERGFERRRGTRGVNKGRYIWFGIGLREDEEPPDPGGDGSPGEPKDSQGSPHGFREGKPDSPSMNCIGEPSEAKNQKPQAEKPHEDKVSDSGFTRFTRFTESVEGEGEPLSAELVPGQSATLEELRNRREGEDLERYLDDPPDWLASQLARCAGDPERWLKPTTSAIAQDFYGKALRAPEVEPVLKHWLEKGGGR